MYTIDGWRIWRGLGLGIQWIFYFILFYGGVLLFVLLLEKLAKGFVSTGY